MISSTVRGMMHVRSQAARQNAPQREDVNFGELSIRDGSVSRPICRAPHDLRVSAPSQIRRSSTTPCAEGLAHLAVSLLRVDA
jgi:hypothetical protein